MAAHAFLMAGVIDIIVMAFYAIDRLVIGVREGHRQNRFRTAEIPGPPDLQITRPQDDYNDKDSRCDDGKKYNLHPETFRTSVKRTPINRILSISLSSTSRGSRYSGIP